MLLARTAGLPLQCPPCYLKKANLGKAMPRLGQARSGACLPGASRLPVSQAEKPPWNLLQWMH